MSEGGPVEPDAAVDARGTGNEGTGDAGTGEPDPLAALRTELEETVDELPVADRVTRFEHANDVLARELAQLDEV